MKKVFILNVSVLFMVTASWAVKPSFAKAPEARPNFVFILVDDLGQGDVSAYNPDSKASTPNLEDLAQNGMMFTNAHSASAICSPTRYNIQTGEHPYRRGYTGFFQNYNGSWIENGAGYTIAQLFQAKGYKTGYSGKWHVGFRAFDSSGNASTLQGTAPSGHPDWSRGLEGAQYDYGYEYVFGHQHSADIGPYKFHFNGKWVSPDTSIFVDGEADAIATGVVDVPADGTPIRTMRKAWRDPSWHFNKVQRRMQDSAVSFINQFGDQPFFLFVAPSGPHTPNVPHKDFQGTTDHNYTDFVSEIDGVLGAVVTALREKGVLDNTFIVFTSDNGSNASSAVIRDNDGNVVHQGTGVIDGEPIKGQKGDLWEGGHRVPYIVRWGDGTPEGSVIQPGTVNNELMSLGDYYRTVAAILDTALGDNVAPDSWNMLSAYLGDGSTQRIREAQFSIRGRLQVTWYREDGSEWKIIFSSGSGGGFSNPKGEGTNPDQDFDALDMSRMQLYNMTTDPTETTDLMADNISANELEILQEGHAILRGYLTSGTSRDMDPDTARVPSLSTKLFRSSIGVSARLGGNNTIQLMFANPPIEDVLVELFKIDGTLLLKKKFPPGRLISVPLAESESRMILLRVSTAHEEIIRQKLVIP